jgi:SAM-dependent methyltransferase
MSGHHGGNPYAWNGGTNNPHIARYFLARGWVMPGETVLDAACCTGYGSHMISQVADKVIGIDVDPGAIDEAHGRWGSDKIDFRCENLDTVEWPDADVLISLESFEHVNDLEHCLEQAQKHIKRLIIVSVPLGGTSWDYTDEEKKLPAGECNDFNNIAHFEKTFTSDEWNVHTIFEFGYSGFGIFYKKAPEVPEGYDENGFKIS